MLHSAVYLAKTTSELCQPCLSADVCDRSEWTLLTPARASYHGLSVDIDKRPVTVAVHDCWDVSRTSFGDVLPSQSLNSVLKNQTQQNNKTIEVYFMLFLTHARSLSNHSSLLEQSDRKSLSHGTKSLDWAK